MARLKKVASALQTRDWTEIDQLLRGFDMPTSEWYEGDRSAYVIEHAGQGSDDALIELEEYLEDEGGAASPGLSSGSEPWEARKFRLFISHTHAYADLAGGLRLAMGRWGVDAFVAHDRIEPAEDWQFAIESALRTCHAVAALWTPDFLSSRWCDQEVGAALGRRVLIVPLMLPTLPHGFIGRSQGLAVGPKEVPGSIADRLYKVLVERPTTRARMAPAVVHRFAASPSFAATRENFELLKAIPEDSWTANMAVDVRQAAVSNNQVGEGSVPAPVHRTLLW